MSVIIGLTGGIAAGKSTVGKILSKHGVRVIDCDKLGHQTYLPTTRTFQQLVEAFGDELVAPDGTIDRKLLGGKVFGKPEELKRLTDIVWPGIEALIAQELATVVSGEVCVVEAAVLFEAGWEKLCTTIWTVEVEIEEAVKRLKKRNNMDEEQARARIGSQMSSEERAAKSALQISNMGTEEELEAVALMHLAKLKNSKL